MIQEIKAFVKNNSYLGFEEQDGNTLRFVTRENGDVGEEEYSATDYNEALRVGRLIKERFEGVEAEVDTIDEWVDLEVTIKD
jgi:hypothetical protein